MVFTWTSMMSVGMTGLSPLPDTTPFIVMATVWRRYLTTPRPATTLCYRLAYTRSTPAWCPWCAVCPSRCPPSPCSTWTRGAGRCWRTTRTWWWTSAVVSESHHQLLWLLLLQNVFHLHGREGPDGVEKLPGHDGGRVRLSASHHRLLWLQQCVLLVVWPLRCLLFSHDVHMDERGWKRCWVTTRTWWSTIEPSCQRGTGWYGYLAVSDALVAMVYFADSEPPIAIVT